MQKLFLLSAFVFSLSSISANAEINVHPPQNLGSVKKLVSNKNFSFCAIDMADKVVCWGDPETGIQNVPVDLGPVKDLSTTGDHACAIDMNDRLRCWGYDYEYIQSWDRTNLAIPEFLVDAKIRAISTTDSEDCATTMTNKIYCWNGTYDFPLKDISLMFENYTQVKPYTFGWCGISPTGKLKCEDDLSSRSEYYIDAPGVPTLTLGIDDWFTVCVINTDHRVQCFDHRNESNAMIPADLGPVKALSVGRANACVIKEDDTLQCWKHWGPNSYPAPNNPPSDKVSSVAAGQKCGCATLISDNTVKCWSNIY